MPFQLGKYEVRYDVLYIGAGTCLAMILTMAICTMMVIRTLQANGERNNEVLTGILDKTQTRDGEEQALLNRIHELESSQHLINDAQVENTEKIRAILTHLRQERR